MARNVLVINVDFKETRVALIEDGVIAELQIERAAHRSTVGNVVLGKVTRVLPGMQAAFIDVGQERAAFLHVEDLIRPDDFDSYLAGDARETEEDTPDPEAAEAPAAPVEAVAAPQVESGDRSGGRRRRGRRRGRGERGDRRDLPSSPAAVSLAGDAPAGGAPGAALASLPSAGESFAEAALSGGSAVDAPEFEAESDEFEGTDADSESETEIEHVSAPDQAFDDVADELADDEEDSDEDETDEAEDEADSTPPGLNPFLDDDDLEDADDESEEVQLPSASEVDAPAAEIASAPVNLAPIEGVTAARGRTRAAPRLRARPTKEAIQEVVEALSPALDGSAADEDSDEEDSEDEGVSAFETEDADIDEGTIDEDASVDDEAAADDEAAEGDDGSDEDGGASPAEAQADGGEGRGRRRRRRGRRRRPEAKAAPAPAPVVKPAPPVAIAAVKPQKRIPARVSRSVPISEVVREGDQVVVQISKEPIGTKGARVTSHVSLPGRYVVYLPTVEHVGISKRIGNARERSRLRQTIEALKPTTGGLIVRTVAEGLTKKQLKADVGYLIKVWAEVAKRRETAKPADILYEELDLVLKAARDLFTDEVDHIVIDDREQHGRLCRFVEMFMPGRVKDIRLYGGEEPIFDAYGIEDEIKRALSRKVPLPSGGSLIVDQAEALTAIDVNTGRYVGKGSKDLEETALKTNLEAVDEIAYQLRFRNLGGLVILDLIDMERADNREKVWRALEQKLSKDKAKTTINRISDLGLIEMTRKRTRESLGRVMHEACFYCDGTGHIQSRETIAYEILRQIRRDRLLLSGYSVRVSAHPAVVDFLKHDARDALLEAERRYLRRIELVPRQEYHIEQYDLQGR